MQLSRCAVRSFALSCTPLLPLGARPSRHRAAYAFGWETLKRLKRSRSLLVLLPLTIPRKMYISRFKQWAQKAHSFLSHPEKPQRDPGLRGQKLSLTHFELSEQQC